MRRPLFHCGKKSVEFRQNPLLYLLFRLNVHRSSHTVELWSAAHRFGDAYYLCLTELHCHGRGSLEECNSAADKYLVALEDLEKHLSTLEVSDDVTELVKSTKTYLRLVRNDIKLAAEVARKNSAR